MRELVYQVFAFFFLLGSMAIVGSVLMDEEAVFWAGFGAVWFAGLIALMALPRK